MALTDIYKHPYFSHLILVPQKETSPDSHLTSGKGWVGFESFAAFMVGHDSMSFLFVQVSSCWSFCQLVKLVCRLLVRAS